MIITLQEQNPMINFRKRSLNQHNSQFEKLKDLPAYEEENLAKHPEENDKKLWASLVQFGEREKVRKPF